MNGKYYKTLAFLDEYDYVFVVDQEKCADQLGNELFQAIAENDINSFYKLMDEGVNLNWTDHNENTPLILAVALKRYEFIEELCLFGVNKDIVNFDLNSALSIAIQMNDNQSIYLLIENGCSLLKGSEQISGPLSYTFSLKDEKLFEKIYKIIKKQKRFMQLLLDKYISKLSEHKTKKLKENIENIKEQVASVYLCCEFDRMQYLSDLDKRYP